MFSIGARAAMGSDVIDVLVWHPQCENVTGQSIQTAGEYVSVGALSAPYHGAGVDGVKYFNTDISGNPIPTATLKGYPAEGARDNKCLQSNAFTTTWTTSASAPDITQNVTGPDGVANSAWTITDNSGAATELIKQTITLTAAAYTYSIRVKKTAGAQSSYPVMSFYTGTTIALATIDTTNGVATAWTAYTGFTMLAGISARCTSFNADYWLVELTATGTGAGYVFDFSPAGTTNATQSSGSINAAAQGSAVIYGAQVELGSFASSYIPTTTIPVARYADVESYPTASNILAAAGSIALTFTPTHTPSGTIALWGTYVDASNYTAILHDATNLIFRKRIAATNYDATVELNFVAGTSYKIAASWGAGGSTIHLNGTAGTPHANTTAAQVAATMQFGADGNSLQQPFANIGDGRIWQRQLSSAALNAITA